MKKLCNFLLILLIVVNLNFHHKTILASASGYSGYAKVLDNCVLYKNENLNDEVNNIFFVVPESYFVFILEKCSADVFKVQYINYVGFVKAERLVLSTFVPVVKFLEGITLDVKASSGTQVWSSPSANDKVLTTIAADTRNITYIASCYGSVPSGGRSNLWYYVLYTPAHNSTSVYEGYVYSENVTNISSIFLNTESNPEVLNENNVNEKLIYISPSIKTIFVVLIAIPIIVLILIILYKLTKKISKNTNNEDFIEKYQDEENDDLNGQNKNKFKNELNKFRSMSFFKRHLKKDFETDSYPEFPNYDSEDDLL